MMNFVHVILWPGSQKIKWQRTHRDTCQLAMCLVFLLQLVQSNADPLPISPESTNDPMCLRDCSNARRKPLCGSDDRTYSSSCELKRVKACLGRKIKIKHKGPCVAELSKCELDRASALEQMETSASDVYVAQCNEDGSYSPVQCHLSFGYCWCVNEDGKPVPGTAIRHQRPTCDAEPVNIVVADQSLLSTPAKPSSKNGCDQTERTKFNENLRRIVRQDYERTLSLPGFDEDTVSQSIDVERKAIESKFMELDMNHDSFLQKKELNAMKRLMRRLIKPKSCVKTFADHCDLNYDEKIAQSEWLFCLGGVDDSGEDTVDDSASSKEGGITIFDPPSSPEEPGTVVLSCRVELQRAISEAERDTGVYIPQCDENGAYNPVQCHEEAEYCWCAYTDNGRPIPGSSSRMPFKADCDPNAVFRAPVAAREFKNCPDDNKGRFLSKLIDAIYLSMNEVEPHSERIGQPTEESMQLIHTVLWEFHEVDTSRNGILEENELLVFSDFVNSVRASKKCKKNFLSYCDSNRDDMVSQREWLQCFEVDGVNAVPSSGSRGRNPFIDRLT